jgi:subtilase family serine protease
MNLSKFARRAAPIVVGFLMVPGVSALPSVASLAAATTAATNASQSAASAPSTLVKVQPTPQLPQGTTAIGAVAGSTALSGAVALQPRNEAALEAFISAVTDKSSPQYHQYLGAGQFESEFGPLPATISAVEQAVEADGLSVMSVSEDGLLIDFSGTASQAETTFHTQIQSYRMKQGWTGRGTTQPVELQLPTSVSADVTGVIGLNNLVQAQASVAPAETPAQSGHPAAQAPAIIPVTGAPTACTDAQQDATTYGGLTDDQIANAYRAFGLYNQGDFGQGEHIAVYELESVSPADAETFDACYFGATEAAQMAGTNGNNAGSRLSILPVDGGQPAGPGGGESILDVEDVSAIAPQAGIDVYEAPNTSFGALDEYSTIVNADTDQVVTSRWGLCEQEAQVAEPGVLGEENFLFQQAAAQGQTVLSSSADTGDDTCNAERDIVPPAGQNLLSEDDPASQPYVVGVGGTTINDATQPPSEQVWNDGASWGGTGGGISEAWAMPSWQRPVALTTNNATDVANGEAFESETASLSAP